MRVVSVSITTARRAAEQNTVTLPCMTESLHHTCLKVIGRTATLQVGGLLSLQSTGRGIDIQNTAYTKDNARLTNLITWRDSAAALLATVGFDTADSFRFALRNALGDIVLAPLGAVDVLGTLKSTEIRVRHLCDRQGLYGGDGKESGCGRRQTALYRRLHDRIQEETGGYHYRRTDGGRRRLCHIGNRRGGFEMKLSADGNLSDVMDKAAARKNIDVYSKAEAGEVFLEISEGLKELVRLTADEISGLTAEEAAELKAKRQAAVRDTLDAERKVPGS